MCLGIMTVPIINKVILGWVAFGAGFAVAGGFIAFISLIGIVTRLAGLTKTADAIPTYENSMALGLIFFNLVSLYQPDLQWISYTAALSIINIVGLFTGIFAGCLAGALAEVVNIIPIFSRRIKLRKGFPYMVKAAAVGKCIGCLIQFYVFCFVELAKLTKHRNPIVHICDFSRCALNVRLCARIQHLLRDHKYGRWDFDVSDSGF